MERIIGNVTFSGSKKSFVRIDTLIDVEHPEVPAETDIVSLPTTVPGAEAFLKAGGMVVTRLNGALQR